MIKHHTDNVAAVIWAKVPDVLTGIIERTISDISKECALVNPEIQMPNMLVIHFDIDTNVVINAQVDHRDFVLWPYAFIVCHKNPMRCEV